MLIGYARTSSDDQLACLEAQVAALEAEGCEKLFQERLSPVDWACRLSDKMSPANPEDFSNLIVG